MDLSIPELIYNRHNLMHLCYACILCRRIKLVYILFDESIYLCYASYAALYKLVYVYILFYEYMAYASMLCMNPLL